MSLISINNLSHVFSDGSYGIRDITLSIEAGVFLVLAGANGSGKTTLCRHFNGLLRPTAGQVLVNGLSVAEDLQKARQLVGMVFQNPDTQIVGETVAADVAFGPENLGLKREVVVARVNSALKTVGLIDLKERQPHWLSGGEKRRLAIAGVLAMKPQVLVFDEPFSNLDYPGSCQILKQIIALHTGGHTVILVTHELEKVIAHSDRLVIMAEGRIVADGDPVSLIKTVERYGVREPCASRFGKELEPWFT